jgi:hypothetical protein
MGVMSKELSYLCLSIPTSIEQLKSEFYVDTQKERHLIGVFPYKYFAHFTRYSINHFKYSKQWVNLFAKISQIFISVKHISKYISPIILSLKL